MFGRPSLVGGTFKRRSNWKSIRESPYFVLQQRGNNNTQQNNNNKRRQHFTEYRIITKGFPHYRVSDYDELSQIQEAFDILHQEVLPEVEGKKTSKKILKQLKSWCARNENLTLPFDEDGDGYATDTSITPEEGISSNEIEDQDNDHYPLISPKVTISSNSSTSSTKSENIAILPTTPLNKNSDNKGKSKIIIVEEDHDIAHSLEQLDFAENNSDYSEDIQSSDGSDNEGVTGDVVEENNIYSGPVMNEWISLGASVLDSLMGWLDGPPLEGINAASTTVSSSKQVNTNASNNNKNQTILDIPMQFIDLLTYPEIDPKASKKASFAVLREISFVKQRRKVLCLLTLYMFLIRLCSFDLFLLLVFISNCAMLFLMKNSGKVNVTMAKRAVRQRIGWAKQWAGSLFKNRANNISAGPSNNRKNGVNNGPNYVSTSNVSVVGVQTTNMTKSASHDALQSGSISDTTHGGSVSTKIVTPKRGVFFRNKTNQTGTSPQTNIKEDKVITSTTETSSLTGSSTLQRSPSDFPLNSSPSITGANFSIHPQVSFPISGGGNVSELSQPANTSSNTALIQQSLQSPKTKMRFFNKRGSGGSGSGSGSNNNSSNNNNNFTLPQIVPLPEILHDSSSSTYKSSQSLLTLAMTSVPTATGGIVGHSGVINGNGGSNEGSIIHPAKSPNINMNSNNQQQPNNNSYSNTANSDLLVNDNCEGETFKFLVGDLKVK